MKEKFNVTVSDCLHDITPIIEDIVAKEMVPAFIVGVKIEKGSPSINMHLGTLIEDPEMLMALIECLYETHLQYYSEISNSDE